MRSDPTFGRFFMIQILNSSYHTILSSLYLFQIHKWIIFYIITCIYKPYKSNSSYNKIYLILSHAIRMLLHQLPMLSYPVFVYKKDLVESVQPNGGAGPGPRLFLCLNILIHVRISHELWQTPKSHPKGLDTLSLHLIVILN